MDKKTASTSISGSPRAGSKVWIPVSQRIRPTPTPKLQSLVWVPFGAAKLSSPEVSTELRGCPLLILTALAECLLQQGY